MGLMKIIADATIRKCLELFTADSQISGKFFTTKAKESSYIFSPGFTSHTKWYHGRHSWWGRPWLDRRAHLICFLTPYARRFDDVSLLGCITGTDETTCSSRSSSLRQASTTTSKFRLVSDCQRGFCAIGFR